MHVSLFYYQPNECNKTIKLDLYFWGFALLFLPKILNGSPSKLLLNGFFKEPFSILDQKLEAKAIMLQPSRKVGGLDLICTCTLVIFAAGENRKH